MSTLKNLLVRGNEKLNTTIINEDMVELQKLIKKVEKSENGRNDMVHAAFVAVEAYNLAALELLIENGLDVNCFDDEGNNLLMEAVKNNYLSIAEFLIDSGCSIDEQGISEMTSLMLASESGYTAIVQLLLESGADTEVCDSASQTALAIARIQKEEEVIELLLGYGAQDFI